MFFDIVAVITNVNEILPCGLSPPHQSHSGIQRSRLYREAQEWRECELLDECSVLNPQMAGVGRSKWW